MVPVPTAILFLCVSPGAEQLELYEEISESGYDVYVIVDDNSWDGATSDRIIFVQVDDIECMRSFFIYFNPAIDKASRCSAWDKGILFACRQLRHHHVWFIEEDVFIPASSALIQLDRSFPFSDIVSASDCSININEVSAWPWGKHIPSSFLPPPYRGSMVCAIRVSRRLLDKVDEFVSRYGATIARHNKLLEVAKAVASRMRLRAFSLSISARRRFPFIEFIFHTLALHNGYQVAVAEELSGIVWRHDWRVEEMRPDHLYHPVKAIAEHPRMREQLLLQQPEY